MILDIHNRISEAIDSPPDLVKTLLILILSTFMAPIFSLISSPKLRYLYSLIPGILFVFYMVELWAFYVLAVIILPFILMKIIPKYSFEMTAVLSFFFLLYIHGYRFINDSMGWKIDCSVMVMYQVTKVTYYASYIKKQKKSPEIIPYLSHCLFFPSVTIGPAYSFEVFKNFIEKQQQIRIPEFKNIIFGVVKTIVLFTITAKALKIFPQYFMIENQTFMALPSYAQFLSLNFIGFFFRIKFYSAWSLTQLAVDLSGLSWDQKQKNFDLVKTGSIKFETELNPKLKTQYWNTSVQMWFKDIIFSHIFSRTKSHSISTYLTFLISAFWHGMYLTYYVGFIQWAVIIVISKWAFKCSQILPQLSKVLWVKAIAFLVASSLLNYTGMMIVTLTWKQALQACSNMKFIGHFLLVFLLIVSFTIKPSFFKKLIKQQ